jgi:hypothetical protein
MTWYTTPEAVALLDGFKRKPRIKHAKSVEWCSSFAGRRAEALGALWCRSGEVGSHWHVLGAIFGDPNGVGSVWDTSDEWAAIRTKLAATGGLTACRAASRQKEVS